MPKLLDGVMVPAVTPAAHCGDHIDEHAIHALFRHFADGGAAAVLVLGTTGEASSLAGGLRFRVVEAALAAAHGRLKVVAGVASNCLEESIGMGREFLRMGVDAVLSHAPCYLPVEEANRRVWFERLAEGLDGPLVLYNMPATTGFSLTLETIEALAADARVVGLKDSSSETERHEALRERFGARTDLELYCGSEAYYAEALAGGYDGIVPGMANLAPEVYAAMHRAARAGDAVKLAESAARGKAIRAACGEGRAMGQVFAAMKFVLSEKGLCGEETFPPLLPLGEAEKDRLREKMRELGVLA